MRGYIISILLVIVLASFVGIYPIMANEEGQSAGGPIFLPYIASNPLDIIPGSFEKVFPPPSATGQPTSLVLDWAGSSGVVSFAYCYDTSDDNACGNWISTGAISQASISGLNTNTVYYWQVKAANSGGETYANDSAAGYWSFATGSVIPGEMVLIPAGSFQMGCQPDHNGGQACNPEELPLHTVTLDAYRIDKYEVTNGQYTQCVAAGRCGAPAQTSSWTRSSYYEEPAYASYPVVYTAWQDAANYCVWAGKRLPSEAEWEKAARGASVAAYPWGDAAPACDLVNGYVDGYGVCLGDTSAVGSYAAGASFYGVMDMAGNVKEWVNDWYDSSYYASSPPVNPPGPASGYFKVPRGGSWLDDRSRLRVASRDHDYIPDIHNSDLGFRCAASPQ